MQKCRFKVIGSSILESIICLGMISVTCLQFNDTFQRIDDIRNSKRDELVYLSLIKQFREQPRLDSIVYEGNEYRIESKKTSQILLRGSKKVYEISK